MIEIVLVICVLSICWCLWGLHAIERTGKERHVLIDAIYAAPNWRELHWAFKEVTFDQHSHEIMMFRDPWKLYSPEIRKLMGK